MDAEQPNHWSITVLLADDDEDDRELIAEAVEATGVEVRMRFVTDGQELLEYLRREDGFDAPEQSPRPSMILLDLNMPRKTGHEVLAEIKADEALRQIPVVVLTTSRDEHDITESYDLGANSYVTKPMTHAALTEVMGTIIRYWTEVELPDTPDGER